MPSKRPQRPVPSECNAPLNRLTPKVLDTPELVMTYCRDMDLYDGNSLDIAGLIQDSPELTLVHEPLGYNDAYIKKRKDTDYEIGVNSSHRPNRQRVSMAHEFAHYQLHRDRIERGSNGEEIIHRREGQESIEVQANRYIAEMLMPEREFFDALKRTNGDVSAMASLFGVSQLALRFRAKHLGLSGSGV